MMGYDSKVLLKRSLFVIVKRLVIDVIIIVLIILLSRLILLRAEELFSLILNTFKLN